MPGTQLPGLDPVALGQLLVDLPHQLLEGRVGLFGQIVEDRSDFFRILLDEPQAHLVEVVVPQLFGHLVAQTHQFDHLVAHQGAPLLVGFPGVAALLRIGGGLEDIVDVVVGDLPASHRPAVVVEHLLDFGGELHHLLKQLGRHLVLLEGQEQDGKLALQQRVFDLAAFLYLLEEFERLRAGVYLADLQFLLAGKLVRFLFPGGGGVPERQVLLFLQRSHPGHVLVYEGLQLGLNLRGALCLGFHLLFLFDRLRPGGTAGQGEARYQNTQKQRAHGDLLVGSVLPGKPAGQGVIGATNHGGAVFQTGRSHE